MHTQGVRVYARVRRVAHVYQHTQVCPWCTQEGARHQTELLALCPDATPCPMHEDARPVGLPLTASTCVSQTRARPGSLKSSGRTCPDPWLCAPFLGVGSGESPPCRQGEPLPTPQGSAGLSEPQDPFLPCWQFQPWEDAVFSVWLCFLAFGSSY